MDDFEIDYLKTTPICDIFHISGYKTPLHLQNF